MSSQLLLRGRELGKNEWRERARMDVTEPIRSQASVLVGLPTLHLGARRLRTMLAASLPAPCLSLLSQLKRLFYTHFRSAMDVRRCS